eukprot:CAMPEP_0184295004 /NCGR_PEP_ID=MMETSP1049-20130417/6018_1 /TAXON_ID=77928 /ORGANISM="Proteomonas sulcata, Strain CCMP704" /LENGTH=341 /DNA_ID=CAMNT_0026603431 /DNA_START=115 /DNA_END=1140 /DNA_ORIENTATION=-
MAVSNAVVPISKPKPQAETHMTRVSSDPEHSPRGHPDHHHGQQPWAMDKHTENHHKHKHNHPAGEGAQQATPEEKEETDDFDEDAWAHCAENAYGAFIHVAHQSGLFAALMKCGPMVMASVLIQSTFSYELWRHLPTINDAVCFCYIPPDLQFSAVCVFVTLMLNNVPNMARESAISVISKEFITEATEHQRHNLYGNGFKRFAIFFFAVFTEMVTWSGIMYSGVLFILTAPSVDLVIRSTVAIMFVQNVDEIIFDSCCSNDIKQDLQTTQYHLFDWGSLIKMKKTTSGEINRLYGLFVHLPVLFIISAGVVHVLRAEYPCEDSEWFIKRNPPPELGCPDT